MFPFRLELRKEFSLRSQWLHTLNLVQWKGKFLTITLSQE